MLQWHSLLCCVFPQCLPDMGCVGLFLRIAVLKNLLRGAALAMLATFLGCFVVFTFPDWVAAQLNRSLPYWFYEREVSRLA